jgi:hypothetical protein
VSGLVDALRELAVPIIKEGVQLIIEKVRAKAKDAAREIPDSVIEKIVETELLAVYVAALGMVASLEVDARRLADSEAAFRASPNVTVVESMDEPGPGDENG